MSMRERYDQVLDEAKRLTAARDYRNNYTTLENMFPHGTQDITFMLHMKLQRMLGSERDPFMPSPQKISYLRDEAIDVINYAAFLVAMIDQEMLVHEGDDV